MKLALQPKGSHIPSIFLVGDEEHSSNAPQILIMGDDAGVSSG